MTSHIDHLTYDAISTRCARCGLRFTDEYDSIKRMEDVCPGGRDTPG